MATKEPEAWITVNGKRVPIFAGESKADAVKNALSKDQDTKEKQINQNKKEADKRNIKDIKNKEERQEAQVQKHLGNIVWNKAIGSDGQAETGKYPVKGIEISKFCDIASRIDKKYDYDWEHDTSKGMGQTIHHYYIIRDRK